jgi:hypothetical protein
MLVRDNVKKYLQKMYGKILITRMDMISFCKERGMKFDEDYVSNEELISFIKKE